MNRRASIKGLLVFATLGVSSFSIYKWITSTKRISESIFQSRQNLIAEIAEVIIPRTDTPGAKDVNVENFVVRVMAHCADTNNQRNFIQGLDKLEEYSIKTFESTFVACSKEQQIDVLKYCEEDGRYSIPILNKISNRLIGKPFFVQIKELVVEGYCKSELGATRGLAYEHTPGRFVSCMSISREQKSWATK